MLAEQAATLDAIFHKLARIGLDNVFTPDHADVYLKLAFRAQSQARCAVEALSELKNPRALFVNGQANIGGNVQVNNDARGEKTIAPTELNGVAHEVDGRGKAPAIGVDPAVEAVGAINGATIARRQGDVVAKPASGGSPADAAQAGKAAAGD